MIADETIFTTVEWSECKTLQTTVWVSTMGNTLPYQYKKKTIK